MRLSRRALLRFASLTLGAGLVAVADSCASMGAPPGGPPDKEAPQIVQVMPDSAATGVHPARVIFRFDEVVGERPVGAATLAGLFLISPRDGEPDVHWHRDYITVRPRRGFRDNTVYTVTMLAGLSDLRGNVRQSPATALFSTGGSIPNTSIRGVVFDWVQARAVPRALVQALAQPATARDTTIYVTQGDSTGRFTFAHLPTGSYVVRAVIDANNSRALESREAWDTVRVALRDSASIELYAFAHDTLGPRLVGISVKDSLTLRVTFDRPLDTAQVVSAALFRLRRADSSEVAITRARSARAADSATAAASKGAADSAAARDTTKKPDSTAIRKQTRADTTRPSLFGGGAAAIGNVKTVTTAQGPTSKRPIPVNEAVIELGAPVLPGNSYRLYAIALRSLQGIARNSDRPFTIPKPKPVKVDSTKAGATPRAPALARPDTTRPPPPPVRPDSARPPER